MKLIISEKEIAARRIAKILSGDGLAEEKICGVPVYGFKIGDEDYKVMGLRGHIMQVGYPKEYANWVKVDPMELITARIEKVPIKEKSTNKKAASKKSTRVKADYVKALKKMADDTSEIILATDFDREGELIGYDAWQVVKEKNSLAPVKRAKFSAITPRDINEAFAKLGKVDLNLAFAGRARQDIDLIWGATLTRFISLASFQIWDKYLSVGRVQTPTLTLIVNREMEIKSFVPILYWVVNVKLATKSGQEFEATHKKKRFLKKDEAYKAYNNIKDSGTVLGVTEKTRKLAPPAPFNTTSLIVIANAIGFAAARTISIAENLYMNGYISYPRTDNTVYPSSIGISEIAKMFDKSDEFKEMSREVISQEKIVASRGKKRSTDHPPIYPTSVAEKKNLKSDVWKLYELIVRRFMCTLLPSAEVKSITADIDIGGELFRANGSNIIKLGWTKFYPYFKHEDVFIPDLEAKQILTVSGKEILDKQTKPSSRYTQGRLVEKMEELGLGTKATRHTIIQNLMQRGYIHGNPLTPSEKAVAVIKMLKKHAEKISSPDMTSELEMYMDGIASGDQTKEEVVDKSREMLKDIMVNLKNGKEEISQEIKDGIKKDLIVGKCMDKDCDGNLIIRTSRKTKKRFIGCSAYPKCTNTFSLPQNGLILTTEQKCKHCGYPVVRVIRKGRRPWDLCINNICPGKNANNKKFRYSKGSKKAAD